jgi:pimeloyl-ACP methyl ester carboxylesterase
VIKPPAFALLHGGGHGSWVWEDTVRALEAQGAAVLALDVPGCGVKRGRQTLELGVEAVAEELLADIAASGLRDVVLVGHSQAGTMLPVLAERQPPGLFRRLVYLSCCAPLPGQNILEMMGGGVQGAHPDEVGWPLDPDAHGREIQRPIMFCNDMDEAQTRTFLARLDLDSWPMAVTYAVHWAYDHLGAVPSSYILCERDGILPPAWQERFAERLHVDRIVRLDAGHQAMNTQPETLAEMLMVEARL